LAHEFSKKHVLVLYTLLIDWWVGWWSTPTLWQN